MYTRIIGVTLYPDSDGRIPIKAEWVEIFHDLVLNPWEYSYLNLGYVKEWEENAPSHYELLDIAVADRFNVVLKDVTVQYRDWDNLPEGEHFRGWYLFYKDAFTVFNLGSYRQIRERDKIVPSGRPKPTPLGL